MLKFKLALTSSINTTSSNCHVLAPTNSSNHNNWYILI